MKIKEKCSLREHLPRILANIGLSILLLFAFLCFFAACWYVEVFGNTGFDSVIFTLTGGLGGVSGTLVRSFLVGVAVPALVSAVLVGFLLLRRWNWQAELSGNRLPYSAAAATTAVTVLLRQEFCSCGASACGHFWWETMRN